MDAAAELAEALLGRVDESGAADQVTGVVTVVSPLTVRVRGADLLLPRLSWYSPTVGDVVLVLTGQTWTVLGKVVPP